LFEIVVEDFDQEKIQEYAEEAAQSAAEALASENAAANSADAASGSATTATTQAGIATTQAGIATTQSGIATTKANEASASAAGALASEQAADADRIAAQAAASTATTQAGIATTQAGIATTKAGEASDSAAAALASETDAETAASTATTQAGIATTKAQEAAASAQEAQDIVDSITPADLTEATSSVLTITGGTDAVLGSGTTIQVKQAGSSQSGFLSSTDWTTFNNKENAITAGTTAQYFRGDKTFQTLNTSVVPELTNLYYTDGRARSAISLTTTGASGSSTYNNSTGVLNVPTYTLSGLGGIGGTLATGQVAFGTAANTIGGDAGLNWDNTNKRLGIGLNNPTEVLHILRSGAQINATAVLESATGQAGVRLLAGTGSTNRASRIDFFNGVSSVTVPRWTLINDFFQNGTNDFSIVGENVRKIVVFQTGNVVIQNGGTFTDAGFRLDVNGTARVQGNLNVSTGGVTLTGAQTIQTSTGNLTLATAGGNGNILISPNGAGAVGIGNAAFSGFNLYVGKSFANAGTYTSIAQQGVVASTVTNEARSFDSFAQTAAASFTLSSYVHYRTQQATLGAGSAITNQYGFWTDASLIGATNNYGFFGNIAAGAGRWNLYMNGTANNYLAGKLLIGSTTDVPSASVAITSTTQGFLPPRMTSTQRDAIASPASGLVIYNTTTNLLNVYNGTMWI
jgi:hypothetical protein